MANWKELEKLFTTRLTMSQRPVAVTFLTFRAETVAVSVLVLISAAFGAAVMLLLGLSREVNLRWRHRAVAQQLKAAQTRVAQLEAAQAPPTTGPSIIAA